MKSGTWTFGIIALLLIIVIGAVLFVMGPSPTESGTQIQGNSVSEGKEANNAADSEISGQTNQETGSMSSEDEPMQNVRRYTIEADDDGFYMSGDDISSISVSKGDMVEILFQVRSTRVYYNGLDFRGFGNDVGAKPGESVMFEFTAENPGTIVSYWPSSGVVKDRMQVNVV